MRFKKPAYRSLPASYVISMFIAEKFNLKFVPFSDYIPHTIAAKYCHFTPHELLCYISGSKTVHGADYTDGLTYIHPVGLRQLIKRRNKKILQKELSEISVFLNGHDVKS